MHANRQPRSATAPPVSAGLSRSVPAAGLARRRSHGGASSATGPSGAPPPRPAWVGIAESKPPLESSAVEEDFHPRKAITHGLRRGASGKENRAAAGGATRENGRRGERQRASPYSSSRAGQPRSSSIPSRGDKPGGDGGSGHVQRRGKSAPPKTAAAAPRVAMHTNKRKVGAHVGPSAIRGNNGNAGTRIAASSAYTRGRGGGGSAGAGNHPPPYDSLGRQTLRRDGDGASSTAKRRWRPVDAWTNDNHVGDGGDGGSNTDTDDEAWAEKSVRVQEGAGNILREDGGEPTWGVRGSDTDQVQSTVSAQRFTGEPLRGPFSRSFSRQENGAELESRGVGLEGRQDEKEGEQEGDQDEERGAGPAAGGDKDKDNAKDEGETDSLDDRLPFMLASLKRVALTVHDLQGRCARLSHGEVCPPVRRALIVYGIKSWLMLKV